MDAFEFRGVSRIVFGRGAFAQLGTLASALGRAALVVTNVGEPGDGGSVDRLARELAQQHIGSCFWTQRGEPEIAHVEQALDAARRAGCDMVVGFGGGSAIDIAKAVAGLLSNGGSPLDYMEVIGQGRPLLRPAAPWIAVPTTAGTGAEVTHNAVLTCPEKHFKASLRSHHLLATVALLDAELGVGVPPAVTAASGMDALCQLIESYTSKRAQPITDALALQGITLAARALPRVGADGRDVGAREDMALAALLSGLTLANAGLGAVHGLAAPLGANLPVPHGTACAAMLPHVMAANVAALRAASSGQPSLDRYATIGRALTGQSALPEAEAIDAGIRFTLDLVRQLRIPPLADYGLTAERIPELVALGRRASSMRYNPVELSEAALADVLRQAAQPA
jgi:alcohol dehydrogenase class IV